MPKFTLGAFATRPHSHEGRMAPALNNYAYSVVKGRDVPADAHPKAAYRLKFWRSCTRGSPLRGPRDSNPERPVLETGALPN